MNELLSQLTRRYQSSTGETLSMGEPQGSVHIHENVMAALVTLDIHAEAISVGIENLRT